MSYYEELGIPPDAPDAQIRQGYKLLARLLHPDAHSENALKVTAERQMRRLNAIVETLLDPQKRRAYDESLIEPDCSVPLLPEPVWIIPAVGRAGLLQAALRQWFWILLALAVVGLLGWYLSARDVPVSRVAAPELPAAALPAPPQAMRKTAAKASPSAARKAAPEVYGISQPDLSAADIQVDPTAPADGLEAFRPAETVRPIQPAPGTVIAATPQENSAIEHKAEPAWVGRWLYVPLPEEATAGLYAPAFIEFLLAEEHGKLAGSYRARYRVPDKALASEIAFRAEGNVPVGNAARLVWASPVAAKGEMDLTFLPSGLLTVTWWTTAFGWPAVLTSGTATLVKERTR